MLEWHGVLDVNVALLGEQCSDGFITCALRITIN